MLISIVTPVYNCEKYIRETMDSIHSQTYRNFEHIVIDGLSKDNSLAIIKEYKGALLVSEKDKGQTDAINKGFRLAKGDILAWQNADDVYFPETFQKIVDFFEANPEVDVVYGSYQIIGPTSNWVCDVHAQSWNDWKYAHGRFVPMQTTVFWRRKVYESIGELDIDLKYCMDVDFFAKASKKFKFKSMGVFLGQFRIHEESKTHTPTNRILIISEMRKVLARNYGYNFFDHVIFTFFILRSRLAEKVKKHFFKRF